LKEEDEKERKKKKKRDDKFWKRKKEKFLDLNTHLLQPESERAGGFSSTPASPMSPVIIFPGKLLEIKKRLKETLKRRERFFEK
jgi:hypothetical protein